METRYILFGYDGTGHNDYIVTSDNVQDLKQEGLLRLKKGYTANIYDKETGKQHTLSLKKEKI